MPYTVAVGALYGRRIDVGRLLHNDLISHWLKNTLQQMPAAMRFAHGCGPIFMSGHRSTRSVQ